MGALVMADEMTELQSQLESLRSELAESRARLGRAELKAVAALEAAAEKIEALSG
jgi:cell division protein ZapA (FtsZ GTPase activity inhibitor)